MDSTVVQTPEGLRDAERIIFPGVGAAPAAMNNLNRLGVVDALVEAVRSGVPTLGICVGAQVALDRSDEGDVQCIGLIAGDTRLFDLPDPALKVPHIGWNEVRVVRPHPLLEGLKQGDEFYFVHSYFLDPKNSDHVYSTTDYGSNFASSIGQDNFFATQFHPEKSGRFGLDLLKRFATWEGTPC